MNGQIQKLAFLGVGLMGTPMTLRLLDTGHPVSVWNRTASKLALVLEKGAQAVSSPGEVTRAADGVLMCLTDGTAVEEVVFGSSGIAESLGANAGVGKLLVDFSSISPDHSRRMAARLRDETGMGWIDAPVSGGVKGAEEGSLAILAGGDADEIARMAPVLAHLSAQVTHMGPSGAGQVTKLCNQAIVGCNLAVIAEAHNLAARSGVDAAALAQALRGGFADSIPLQIFGPRFAQRITDPLLGHVFTMLKDLEGACVLGRNADAPLPMTALAADILRELDEKGLGGSDIGVLMELFD